MNRYQILIEYEGTLYNGWQIQKKGKSIQENIEIVLSKLLKEKIKIYGSGRTDTGVHAKEQSAHFDTTNKIIQKDKVINISEWKDNINLKNDMPFHDQTFLRYVSMEVT